jgi:hypothetical protein
MAKNEGKADYFQGFTNQTGFPPASLWFPQTAGSPDLSDLDKTSRYRRKPLPSDKKARQTWAWRAYRENPEQSGTECDTDFL